MTADMEAAAKRRQDSGAGALSRGRWFYFKTEAADPSFASALAKHAVMLISVLAQNPRELPLRRVYIRAGEEEFELQQLSSIQSQMDDKLNASKIYGRHREDGF